MKRSHDDKPRPKTQAPQHSAESKGTGWGGPAKGASVLMTTKPFEPGVLQPRTGKETSRRERAETRAKEMEDIIYAIARGEDKHDRLVSPETQVTAATRLHAIYEGTPVARTVNFNVDETKEMTDAELEQRRKTLEGSLYGDRDGQ